MGESRKRILGTFAATLTAEIVSLRRAKTNAHKPSSGVPLTKYPPTFKLRED